MADTKSGFEQIFLTYKDVREANPNWTDRMIEDYLALKRDLSTTADAVDVPDEDMQPPPLMFALLNDIREQIGSGDALTSDETGFTVDSDKLSVDMDEA